MTEDHVNNAIKDALNGKSAIHPDVLKITGFATETQRHLASNLCWGLHSYLEVGLYGGSSFCAAFSNNLTLRGCGIENKSQPFHNETVFTELEANLDKFVALGQAAVCWDDCWTIAKPLPFAPFDFFYYDGEHSRESQAKALPHFIDSMADEFLFMVDDYNWEAVNTGTFIGFWTLRDRIKIEKEWTFVTDHQDHPIWHNGLYVALIRKV